MEQKEKRGQRVGSDRKLSVLSKEREIIEMQKDGEGGLSDKDRARAKRREKESRNIWSAAQEQTRSQDQET